MEQITFEDTAKELVRQLEETLGKLAIAADSGVSTSSLETKAQKLASKLKSSVDLFGTVHLYKGVDKSDKTYSWSVADTLPTNLFSRYADLCKRCGKEQFETYKDSEAYFVEVATGVFINLDDLPDIPIPTFKVKLEGNTLMAVRSDLLAKLPTNIKKLMSGNNEGEE